MSARRRLLIAAGSVALLALVAAGAAALWARGVLSEPWAGWDGDGVELTVTPGTPARAVLEQLAEAGVIRQPRLVEAWLRARGEALELQAGEYRFERPATPLEVVGRVARGDVVLHPVTIVEGWTRWQIAERLAAAGFGTRERLLEVFDDPGPVLGFDPSAPDLEGYLFPDTYHFPRTHGPLQVARAMVRRFVEVTGAEYAARAEAAGLSVREAVTLASLIERETGVSGERRRVSRVFHNRLARGMKMECDPTVLYAHEREGIEVERLLYRHLRYDSPWNTYVNYGLPPGPIANPGRLALEAAVDPTEGNELYFVAAPDGGHTFSTSMAGHLRAVARWRRHQRGQSSSR